MCSGHYRYTLLLALLFHWLIESWLDQINHTLTKYWREITVSIILLFRGVKGQKPIPFISFLSLLVLRRTLNHLIECDLQQLVLVLYRCLYVKREKVIIYCESHSECSRRNRKKKDFLTSSVLILS